MENIFLFNTLEEGWDIDDLHDIDTQEAYCLYALKIPDEKIYGTEILNSGLEVILTDIHKRETHEDWYLNLHKMCA